MAATALYILSGWMNGLNSTGLYWILKFQLKEENSTAIIWKIPNRICGVWNREVKIIDGLENDWEQ